MGCLLGGKGDVGIDPAIVVPAEQTKKGYCSACLLACLLAYLIEIR